MKDDAHRSPQMVLDIIYIVKVHEDQNSNTYPPAVVAMLVMAIVHVVFCLQYFVRGAKGPSCKASTIGGAFALFAVYGIGQYLYRCQDSASSHC